MDKIIAHKILKINNKPQMQLQIQDTDKHSIFEKKDKTPHTKQTSKIPQNKDNILDTHLPE